MKDYTYLYKSELPINEDWSEHWDIFISGFNSTVRVNSVFNKVNAKNKHWLIHNEYNFDSVEIPKENVFISNHEKESDYILDYYDSFLHNADLNASRICIDITGMMRPHLMFLVNLLIQRGAAKFDVIYSEPAFYVQREKTRFSEGFVDAVRQVAGFEGIVNNDTSGDLLIIGAGYESQLIEEVADDKDKAKKLVLLGLPSLRADMYQQNAIRTHLAGDALGEGGSRKYFAPASDPFVTASVLSEMVSREKRLRPVTNLYLSPLSTKAQALGFVLLYITECKNDCASIIFPFNKNYSNETSDGIARIWKYTLQIPITC